MRKDLENRSLKVGKDHWESGNWNTTHSTSTRWSKRRTKEIFEEKKEISIEENDTQYKEIDTTKLFSNGESNESDATIVDLMEKYRAQAE